MAEWGLKPKHFANEFYGIWPENWRAFEVFSAIRAGAWSMNHSGPVGIRPEAYAETRFSLGIKPKEWRRIYQDLCVMEDAALEHMRATHGR